MSEKRISSRDNALFKDLRACLEPKGLRKLGLFILSGRKPVTEFMRTQADQLAYVLATDEMDLGFLPISSRTESPRVVRLDRPLFDELDLFGTKAPLAVGRVPTLATWEPKAAPQGLEILCALGEPSNVGALLRSCAAFEVHRIVLLKESATPFHPKALRAAAGTTWLTELVTGPSIQELEAHADSLWALDMDGKSLATFAWPKDTRLLLGQEGPGVPNFAGLKKIRIEMNPQVESLNATVAASLALFSYRQRFPLS